MTLLSPPRLALAAALSLAALGGAQAAQYTRLDPAASELAFTYQQMGVSMDGKFAQLQADTFSFDPQQPQNAKVSITVALDSVDAGYDEASAELRKDEWLALAAHPAATFVSREVKPLQGQQFAVTGDLSIKGNTREITIPVTFEEAGDTGVFTGGFTFERADFQIGQGQWQDFGIVANDIGIKFRIIARP